MDDFVFWRPAWIPVFSFGADDTTSGLCLDAETGRLCYWSRYAERWPEYESLTTYLEETADTLETPWLTDGAQPGLIDQHLVWGPSSAGGRACSVGPGRAVTPVMGHERSAFPGWERARVPALRSPRVPA